MSYRRWIVNVWRDEVIRQGHPSERDPGLPPPNFTHLRELTDEYGLWEHARYSTPRKEHGFCADDNARGLVIVAHEPTQEVADLAATYARFLLSARKSDGTFHNRRDATGSWRNERASDDSQGRSWWGLGAMIGQAAETWMQTAALEEFESCGRFQSPHLRANAYAALGAAEVLGSHPGHQPALGLIDRTSSMIAVAARSGIPWLEARLTYDNARIPEALIASGVALRDERRTNLGIRLLEWLAVNESGADHFSFTPVGGRKPGDRGPDFDQQPIEAWAMADACNRAWTVTAAPRWRRRVLQAVKWLLGANDKNLPLYDIETGGTFDGLTRGGVNANQGAESTLAGLGALQIGAKLLASQG